MSLDQEAQPLPRPHRFNRRTFLRGAAVAGAGLTAAAALHNSEKIGSALDALGSIGEAKGAAKPVEIPSSLFEAFSPEQLQALYNEKRNNSEAGKSYVVLPVNETAFDQDSNAIKIEQNGNSIYLEGLKPESVITSPVDGQAFLTSVALVARDDDPKAAERRTTTSRYSLLWLFNEDNNGKHRSIMAVLGGKPLIELPPVPNGPIDLERAISVKIGQPLMQLPSDLEGAREKGTLPNGAKGDVTLIDYYDKQSGSEPVSRVEPIRTSTGNIAISSSV